MGEESSKLRHSKSKFLVLKFLILVFSFFAPTPISGRLIMGEYNSQYELSTSFLNYPMHEEELDVIWRYDHGIHLDIREFELDGQSGDFLLVSDLPLTFEETLNNTSDLPASIVTSQGLLLSWSVGNETDIQVLTKLGCFLYFHAEYTTTRGSFPFKGFNISVENLDEMRTPPPTTTTEPTLPEETVPVYVTKFLSCNPPQEFLKKKEEFKAVIGEIATGYCRETEGCREYLSGDILGSEVNIPTEGGIHYCDPLWEVFDTCVEVKFAISRKDDEELGYLIDAEGLEDMWTKKEGVLRERGYCTFIPPPVPLQIVTWKWMAPILGIIILLLIPICLVWVWSEREYRPMGEMSDDQKAAEKEEEEFTIDKRFFDRGNPIYQVIDKIRRSFGGDSKLYFGYSSDTTGTLTGTGAHSHSDQKNVTTNVIFQEQEVSFEYDNNAYLRDPDRDGENGPGPGGHGDGEPIYGHGHATVDLDFKPMGNSNGVMANSQQLAHSSRDFDRAPFRDEEEDTSEEESDTEL